MLTDAQVNMAVGGIIKSRGSVDNSNFGLNNLRRIDNEPGAMFVKTDGVTIEYAGCAGQAVLQFQECKVIVARVLSLEKLDHLSFDRYSFCPDRWQTN